MKPRHHTLVPCLESTSRLAGRYPVLRVLKHTIRMVQKKSKVVAQAFNPRTQEEKVGRSL